MIFRLSQKLNDRIGAGKLPALPLDENPFADWSATLFTADIASSSATVRFAKALNRSATGSMNDLMRHAEYWLTSEEVSPHDVSFKLNGLLMSALAPSKAVVYGKPREAFKAMHVGQHAEEGDNA